MSDLHIVIEAKQMNDGSWGYRACTPALAWHEAQEVWTELDDARRAGTMGQRIMRGDGMSQHFFMVRADNDPTWASLVRPTVRKGIEAVRNAAKDYGRSQGYEGRSGGWLYAPSGRVVGQGWASLQALAIRRKHLRNVELPNGKLGWYNTQSEFVPMPGGE